MLQSIGQLDFSYRPRTDGLDGLKDFGDQNVASDDSEVGRRIGGLGLFDEIANAVEPVLGAVMIHRVCVDHAISGDILLRNFHQRDHRRTEVLVNVEQLAQAWNLAFDDVVGKDDGERFRTNQLARAKDGVSQPERLLLADVSDIDHVRNIADHLKQIRLLFHLEQLLHFEADVEMILDRALPSASDDNYVFDAGLNRFLDAILNQRLVDQRQHLFGLGFGGGQEAGA